MDLQFFRVDYMHGIKIIFEIKILPNMKVKGSNPFCGELWVGINLFDLYITKNEQSYE